MGNGTRNAPGILKKKPNNYAWPVSKKGSSNMKILAALFLAFPLLAFSADDKPNPAAALEKHIKMHETMAKAHNDAVNCLKAGKTMEECRRAFRESCNSANAPGMCGMGHGKGKQGRMKR